MRSLYIAANAAIKIREIKNEKIRRTYYEKKGEKRGRDISAPEYKMCIDAFLTSRAFILPSFQSSPLIPLTWQKREPLLWYPLQHINLHDSRDFWKIFALENTAESASFSTRSNDAFISILTSRLKKNYDLRSYILIPFQEGKKVA